MDKLDSIVLSHEPVVNNFNHLFAIEQESFRFDTFKQFAVYYYVKNFNEPVYFGNWQVVTKTVFKLKNLSPLMSILFFGLPAADGKKELLRIKWKGRVGPDSDFCMIAFTKIGSNPALDKRNFDNPVKKV